MEVNFSDWGLYYGSKRFSKLAYYNRKQKNRAIELGLPIPNTGKRNWRRYYRRPQHMCVYEHNINDWPEYDIKGFYNKEQMPPNAYDDPVRGSWEHDNWKKYRHHQWKG